MTALEDPTPRPTVADHVVAAVDRIVETLAQLGDFATFVAQTILSVFATIRL